MSSQPPLDRWVQSVHVSTLDFTQWHTLYGRILVEEVEQGRKKHVSNREIVQKMQHNGQSPEEEG